MKIVSQVFTTAIVISACLAFQLNAQPSSEYQGMWSTKKFNCEENMADGTVVFGISDKEVAWYEIYCDIQKTRINGNKTLEQVAAKPAQQMPVDAAISNAPVGVKTQSGDKIKLDQLGGVFTVPVLINDSLKLHFVLDSGAADVSIPADVVSTLVRTGTITETDFIGSNKYRLADGSIVSSRTFNIKSLKVGDKTITNVLGSVADVNGSLLLGQSFLKKFKSWSLNNETHELILE